MALSILSNAAANQASFSLNKNSAKLQQSLSRLSSGKKITTPSDDAGGLAVSMKLTSAIGRNKSVIANIQNALSFAEVQDGALQSAATIVNRMAELKSMSLDVIKSSADVANYNVEFKALQEQLHSIASEQFNGVSLFGSGSSAVFGGTRSQDVTVSIFTSATGESGSKVSINRSMLLSALTIDAGTLSSAAWTGAANGTFAVSVASKAMDLSAVSVGVFNQALQNIATLRAENGGSVSRLQFAQESAAQQRTNLEAANGRIVDVDIATESTTLAKYNILIKASASMLAQANSTPNVALMLIS